MATTLILQNLKPKHTILSKLVEQIKPVFLYKVSRLSNEITYDTCDSFICAATSIDNARNIHPNGNQDFFDYSNQDFFDYSNEWVESDKINTLTVERIGVADISIKENTVIIKSYNVG